MYLELTTGSDSFRAQGSSLKRNVKVSTFVRVDDDGEGNKVVPVFAAFQRKLKGFRESSLYSVIPSGAGSNGSTTGQWFVNRHEFAPGTEVLVKYEHKPPHAAFAYESEYQLLIVHPDAPLYRMMLQLPPHHLSVVPTIFFQGRFELLTKDDQLSEHSRDIWKDWIGFEDGDDLHLSDLMDCQQDDGERFFVMNELEARTKAIRKTQKIEKKDGSVRFKIRRTRNIRTN